MSPETTQRVLLCLQGQAQKLRVPEPESMELGQKPGRIGTLPAKTGFLGWGWWGWRTPFLIFFSLAEVSRWNGLTDSGHSKARRKLEGRAFGASSSQAWKLILCDLGLQSLGVKKGLLKGLAATLMHLKGRIVENIGQGCGDIRPD